MEFLPQWFDVEMSTSLKLGAFISGVALFYLVMQRTRKHRSQDMGSEQ